MTKWLNGTCLHPLDQIKTPCRERLKPPKFTVSLSAGTPSISWCRAVCPTVWWSSLAWRICTSKWESSPFCFSWLWLKESTENLQDRSNITNTWVNKAGSVIKKRSFSKPKTSFRGLKLHFKMRPLERPTHWCAALAGVSPRLSCKRTDEQHPLPHYCSSHETEGVVLDVAAPAAKAHEHSPIER